MPTPIGHSLAGLIFQESTKFMPFNSAYKSLLMAFVLANLADVDILPGMIMGNPNKYHHGVSHSMGAALLVGLMFGLYSWYKEHKFYTPFIFATSIYFSHVFLDYLCKDTSFPYGVPMFWPITSSYFISPMEVFSDVHKDSSSGTFLQSLFVMHNFWTIVWEFIILGSLTAITFFVKRKAPFIDLRISQKES